MASTEVLVVGAGPTGLTLACELARHGVRCRVVDKAPAFPDGSRAKGLQPRSLEVLDLMGVAEQVLAFGRTHLPTLVYRRNGVVTELDTTSGWERTPAIPYPDLLWIPQWRIEQVLRELLAGFGVHVELGCEVVAVAQDALGATATMLHNGQSTTLTADYVVGCDGGHSAVRRLLEFPFVGTTFEEDHGLVGDVEVSGLDREHGHVWADPERGFLGLTPLPSTDLFQLQAAVPWQPVPEPSLATFRRIVDEVAGLPGLQIHRATWLSSARVNVRMVDRYRTGRALLAGDAAHCHSPAGGQGMNTGIQDAHNLGWKLAQVLRGADESLLDTYEQERLPVARAVLDDSERRRRRAAAEGVNALRGLAADQDTSGLTISYRGSDIAADQPGPGDGPRAGDRAPDAIHHDTGRRLFDLFRGPHWTVLSFGVPTQGLHRWHTDGVHVHAIDEAWQAHDTYGVTGAAVFVVRPDGYLGLISRGDTIEEACAPVPHYLTTAAHS